MNRFGWRLLFAAAFVPIGVAMGVWVSCMGIAASLAWLARGPVRRDGQDRIERWMFGRAWQALLKALEKLACKAGVSTDPFI